jgi:hypothetical protein
MFIYIILLLSITLNVLLAWFARKVQTEYILFIRDNLEALSQMHNEFNEHPQMHNEFNEHLEVVNNMEMYFGDQTLVGLLEHSKFVKEQTAEFLLVLQGLDEEAEEE